MLDLACILFTTALSVFAAFRALEMDRRLPWFGREAEPEAGAEPGAGAARRRRG